MQGNKYIVTDARGPLQIVHLNGAGRCGILMHGDVASVFTTWKRAKGAINRNLKYIDKRRYNWDKNYRIMRLVA